MKVKLTEYKNKIGAFQFYVLVVVCLFASAYAGFRFGSVTFDYQSQKIARLEQTVDNLQSDNNELVRKLNILGVELEVGKVAGLKAQQSIQDGLQREAILRREVAFYQKVMAPELTRKGFVIDGFNVEPTLSDGVYRFDLVLMQQDRIKNVVKGNVKVLITGSEEGIPRQYSLSELLIDDNQELSFSFRYFQVIPGQFRLPAGFRPEKISVAAEVFQFKRKLQDLELSFDWVVETSSESATQ